MCESTLRKLAWEFTLITGEEALSAQLFGRRPENPALNDRIGDLVALPHNNAYLWWPNHINMMQGRHGGLSRLEMLIPLYALPLDRLSDESGKSVILGQAS